MLIRYLIQAGNFVKKWAESLERCYCEWTEKVIWSCFANRMGLVSISSDSAYWSQSCLYKDELFGSIISRDRFEAIKSFLNFAKEFSHPEDRLAKIC